MPIPSAVTSPPNSDSVRKALPPFENRSADIVLRSADLVDFLVHSHILIVASSFFETMLSLPQTPSQDAHNVDGRPLVEVAEDSATLETLLLICYPVEKEEVSRTVSETERSLRAAMKYEMPLPSAILTKDLRTAASSTPLPVWAAASRLNLESVARHAAGFTLKQKLTFPALDMLEGVSAADYFRLRQFHRLYGNVNTTFRLLSAPTNELSTADVPSILPPREFLPDMPYPDLICRSSDDVDFHVHRAFVSVASPMLYSRIREALSEFDGIAGRPATSLPLLVLEESSHILAPLLRMCYPTIPELPTPPDDYAALLSAAEKYQMTRIRDDIRKQWRLVAQAAPFESYFTAARLGWREGAKIAARFTLKDNSLAGVYHPSLERTQALTYHSWLSYHEASRRIIGNKYLEVESSSSGYKGKGSLLLPSAPTQAAAVEFMITTMESGSNITNFCRRCALAFKDDLTSLSSALQGMSEDIESLEDVLRI
ncbi:hypothetical protein C8T65DRAFT_99335 [Cerioporus squamosus]|nr:hypothetical protein C8T65DRAFT_99335 [Cerioporus squamosus]